MYIIEYLCDISYINIGIFIIIFIIILSLVIFAPRSKNFYTNDIFPIVQYIHKNNHDIFDTDLQLIKEESKNNKDIWVEWPDKKNIVNEYLVYPIYMFSIYSYTRYILSINTMKILKNIPYIKSISYLKLDKKSKIKKTRKWKDISNDTLCCFFILESTYSSNPEDCCIWVNGEIKPLIKNKLIIYDSSKEHSMVNNTNYPVYILCLDIKKPKEMLFGASDISYDSNVKDFIKLLNKENKQKKIK